MLWLLPQGNGQVTAIKLVRDLKVAGARDLEVVVLLQLHNLLDPRGGRAVPVGGRERERL